MRDAVVFYSQFDDPVAWRQALRAELPDLGFHAHPDIGDPQAVRYALTWKPPVGFFAAFPNLALVVNLGAGVDSLVARDDLPDVPISRLQDDGMVSLMTSYVLFSVLRYSRDIPAFERAQRRGEWHYIHPRPLSAIKVGVLGLGELGAAAAAALAHTGLDVTGWARTQKTIAGVRCTTGPAALDEVLAANEIVVILLPLTPQTRGLIGGRELSLMRPGAKLINAARGAVIDEPADHAASCQHHGAGAGRPRCCGKHPAGTPRAGAAPCGRYAAGLLVRRRTRLAVRTSRAESLRTPARPGAVETAGDAAK
jgi:glyoxylate/hydroxypyruvate reductase A